LVLLSFAEGGDADAADDAADGARARARRFPPSRLFQRRRRTCHGRFTPLNRPTSDLISEPMVALGRWIERGGGVRAHRSQVEELSPSSLFFLFLFVRGSLAAV
jgi:hypothetical protein